MQALLVPALDIVRKKLTRFVVLKPLFFLPQDRRIRAERWLRGREQARKLARADCVIVSFGKSGRTWLRVHAVALLPAPASGSPSAVSGLRQSAPAQRAIPRIFFTHDNYT